ncbi:MAG: hypothetical protein O7B26_14235 [Planctomycetota bacterium]|nr:hypothetical protein [Planctomycetota bacterium]
MVRLCGACLGLLVFSAMIVRGLLVGNPPEVILERALIGLLGGTLLGCAAGWLGSIIVADNLPTPPETPEDDVPVPVAVEAEGIPVVGSIDE